jgi:hypothetical protein
MPPGRIAALVSGGLAVGALAFAVFEHVKWQDRVSTFKGNAACDPDATGRGSMTCNAWYDEGQTARTLAFVGYGAAGAFAAASVVFYLITPANPTPSAVACSLEPGSLGVSCGGRF